MTIGTVDTMKSIRSHLKKKVLVQDQGEAEFQPTGILKYVEDLKRGSNAEVGPKDFFEIASNPLSAYVLLYNL